MNGELGVSVVGQGSRDVVQKNKVSGSKARTGVLRPQEGCGIVLLAPLLLLPPSFCEVRTRGMHRPDSCMGRV